MQDPIPMAQAAAPAAPGWLLALHLLGVVVYAGGVIVMSRVVGLLSRAPAESRAASASVARSVYIRTILPFAGLAVASGVYMLLADPGDRHYLRQHAFHAKLTLVVLLMAAEHMLVLRPLKGLATGTGDPARGGALYRVGHPVVLVLVAAILFALFMLRAR